MERDFFLSGEPVLSCSLKLFFFTSSSAKFVTTYQCDGNIKVICELGHYCIDGIAKACESGTANALSGQISNISCINCAAGLYNPLVGQSVCSGHGTCGPLLENTHRIQPKHSDDPQSSDKIEFTEEEDDNGDDDLVSLLAIREEGDK